MHKTFIGVITTGFAFVALAAMSQVAMSKEAVGKALGPHVHGVASLEIALDVALVTINFSGPLDNLIGFEHMPETNQQKAKVKAMQDRLNKPAPLFYFTKTAQCSVKSVKLVSTVLGDKPEAGEPEGHADVDAEFIYHCSQIKNLKTIKVMLFDFYPNLHKIKVAFASDRGQTAAELSTDKRAITW